MPEYDCDGLLQYVECRREKKRRLMQIDEHYEGRLLKHMFEAWKVEYS